MSKKAKGMTEAEQEVAKREIFIKAISAVQKEHGYAIGCFLDASEKGIKPVPGVVKLVPEEEEKEDKKVMDLET